MKLTILNVAYPFARVGFDAVGGAEHILTRLDEALVSAGHSSLVVACSGSSASGELIAVPLPRGEWTEELRRGVHEAYGHVIEEAVRTRPIDVIHMHGIDCYQYLPHCETPILVTLHLPPAWYPPEIFRLTGKNVYLHCVSATQQQSCPADSVHLRPIQNGVPLDRLHPSWQKRRFAFALGRICPEKGFHLALDASRHADLPLILAGEVFPYADHRRYFNEQIAPRIDRQRRFVGPVGFERKRRYLAAARCLLLPSLAAETSSLVAMEALACGTPVIAFRAGALPEIIEHGRTGFLVANMEEMVEALRAVECISPRRCREAAESRFSAERMCAQYLSVYEQLSRQHGVEAPSRGQRQQAEQQPNEYSHRVATLCD